MDQSLDSFCLSLPKLELHAHLNGSVTTTSLDKLRKLNLETGVIQINENDWEDWKSNCGKPANIKQVFKKFDMVHLVTQTNNAVKMATSEVIKDFFKDNVVYLELRSTPRALGSGSKADYLGAMIEAVLEEQKLNSGIIVKLIVSINRGESVTCGFENVHLAIELSKVYPNIIVGVDLSGNPASGSFLEFKEMLEKAREAGLKVTVHCGEIPAVAEVANMIQFKPDRLGHCTCCHPSQGGSKDIWQQLLASNIPVELCLSSNLQSNTVSTAESHQFQHFYKAKHPLAISTDDKGIFETTLSNEFQLVQETFGLTNNEMWQISYNAIDHIFASEDVKNGLRVIFKTYLKTQQ